LIDEGENYCIWIGHRLRQSLVTLDNVECKKLRGTIEAINVSTLPDGHGAAVMAIGNFKLRAGIVDVWTERVSPTPKAALKLFGQWLTDDQRSLLQRTVDGPYICDDCHAKNSLVPLAH
jgi:hypothetical protein